MRHGRRKPSRGAPPGEWATLPADVVCWVQAHFPAAEAEAALATLVDAVIEDGSHPPPRLLRSAAFASAGDLVRLQYYVGLLAIDWRDVVVAGEYDIVDRELVRARDLNSPLMPNPGCGLK